MIKNKTYIKYKSTGIFLSRNNYIFSIKKKILLKKKLIDNFKMTFLFKINEIKKFDKHFYQLTENFLK